jgi:hypothetical protein
MGVETSNKPNKEVYHQSIPLVVVIATIASMISTYVFYTNYNENDSIAHLILANIFLLITIIFLKPIVEWRRIEIDNEFITIHKLFFKPIRINISQSLYQVVMNKDEIRSYRFRVGNNCIQISPQIYVNGQGLSNRLKTYIARNELIIDAVN